MSMEDEDGRSKPSKIEEFADCVAGKECKWLLEKKNLAAICCAACSFGLMLTCLSSRWRVDSKGSGGLERYWQYIGFLSRQYGVIFVVGARRQTWTDLATVVCHLRDAIAAQSAATTADMIKDKLHDPGVDVYMDCAHDSLFCNGAAYTHISHRCEDYQSMKRMSLAVLAVSLFNLCMCTVAATFAVRAHPGKVGGITLSMFLGAGVLALVMNISWSVISADAFTDLQRSAWYPWPELGAAYTWNLLLCLLLLVSSLVYGRLVLPHYLVYTPIKATIEKHKKKEKKREKEREKLVDMKKKLGLARDPTGNFPGPMPMSQHAGMMLVPPTPFGFPGGCQGVPPQQGYGPQGFVGMGPAAHMGVQGYPANPYLAHQPASAGAPLSTGDFGLGGAPRWPGCGGSGFASSPCPRPSSGDFGVGGVSQGAAVPTSGFAPTPWLEAASSPPQRSQYAAGREGYSGIGDGSNRAAGPLGPPAW